MSIRHCTCPELQRSHCRAVRVGLMGFDAFTGLWVNGTMAVAGRRRYRRFGKSSTSAWN